LNVGNEISKLNTKEKLQKQEDELKNYVVYWIYYLLLNILNILSFF
jgi:hypothetical protein